MIAIWIISWLVVGFVSIILIKKREKENVTIIEVFWCTVMGYFTGLVFLAFLIIDGVKYLSKKTLFDFRVKEEEELDDDEDDGEVDTRPSNRF